jgi:hypothetical protein
MELQRVTYAISRRLQHLLVDTRHGYRRQKDEALATNDLAIDVLVVVSVKGSDAARVADPQVDGIGFSFKSDPRPGYVCFDIFVQCCILVSEVVILLWRSGLALINCILMRTQYICDTLLTRKQ